MIGSTLILWGQLLTGVVSADGELRGAIDAAMAQVATGVPAAPVADHEFLRRVTLDLTGVPPTPEQVAAFLTDPNPAKRAATVDLLLASPGFTRHMTEVFDVMLMERRGNTHIPQEDWARYLHASFKANKPLNVLAREILSADGVDPALRPAARFYLDRLGEPNLLTRDVARIFLGRDLQCAQCHDHPLIDDYHQLDYHALLACLAPGTLVTIKEGDKSTAYYAELAANDVQFESVFIKGTKHVAAPRALMGPLIADQLFPVGEEYVVRPADNVRPVPKFSRRQQLANLVTDGKYRPFNENMANRLWTQMMGRGLVHPPDLHHSANPPLSPELMTLLGERLAAMKFDVRAFLRELALTQVYQRSLAAPPDLAAVGVTFAPHIPEIHAQLAILTTGETEAQAQYEKLLTERDAAEATLLPIVNERDQARAKAVDSLKKVDAAQKAVTDAQAAVVAKQAVIQSITEAVAKTKDVVAKLPQDQELVQAGQKFADRLAQVTAELPALQKSVEEKTAAVQAPTDELVVHRAAVATVDAKLAPLHADVLAKEEAMFAARTSLMAAATKAAGLKRRLQTVEVIAGFKTKGDEAQILTQAVPTKVAEVQAGQKLVAEYGPVVTQRQTEMQSVDQALAVATQALVALQTEQQKNVEIATAVALAATQSEAARVKLAEDPVLTEAAQKLKARADELQQAVAVHLVQVTAGQEVVAKTQTQRKLAEEALAGANAELARRQQAMAATETALVAARMSVQQAQAGLETFKADLIGRWSNDLTIAPLKPLSPEQMCWSILKVTGVYGRYWAAEEAEVNKTAPLSPEALHDPAQVAARQSELEQRTYDKLKGSVAAFIQVYGAAAGQPQGDFFATADQALFAANGGVFTSWVGPSSGNVTERMVTQTDPVKAAEDLYVTLLTRPPTPEEIQEVTTYLAARPTDRAVAVQELAWAVLTSAEFRFSH